MGIRDFALVYFEGRGQNFVLPRWGTRPNCACLGLTNVKPIILVALGPTTWLGICNSGKAQSPINIDTPQVKEGNDLNKIISHNYNQDFPVNEKVKYR